MAAMADQIWFGSTAAIESTLGQAKRVHMVQHLRVPEMPTLVWQKRPAPRLFRELEQPVDSFSKWWVKVNNRVRHLQQLVYPIAPRELPVLNRRVLDEPPQ
jgi:predicted alpha/beta hydrolase